MHDIWHMFLIKVVVAFWRNSTWKQINFQWKLANDPRQAGPKHTSNNVLHGVSFVDINHESSPNCYYKRFRYVFDEWLTVAGLLS